MVWLIIFHYEGLNRVLNSSEELTCWRDNP